MSKDKIDIKKFKLMERIIAEYIHKKSIIDPLSGKPLSKSRRIENLYKIVQNQVFDVKYNKTEKILASKLITFILEEDE